MKNSERFIYRSTAVLPRGILNFFAASVFFSDDLTVLNKVASVFFSDDLTVLNKVDSFWWAFKSCDICSISFNAFGVIGAGAPDITVDGAFFTISLIFLADNNALSVDAEKIASSIFIDDSVNNTHPCDG